MDQLYKSCVKGGKFVSYEVHRQVVLMERSYRELGHGKVR